jgi:hypothetical protein
LTHKTFNNNPVPINLILLAIALTVGVSLTIFVWRKSKVVNKEALAQEADATSEHLMPGPDIQTRDYGTV